MCFPARSARVLGPGPHGVDDELTGPEEDGTHAGEREAESKQADSRTSTTGSIVRYPNASYQYDKVLGPDATSVIDAPKERFRIFGG